MSRTGTRVLPALFACAALLITLSMSADEAHAPSLHRLDAAWTEDNGQTLRLRDLEGNVQLLVLFYTQCTGTCPMTVKALQMFARSQPAAQKARTRFLLFTVDTETDTLPALREYRRTMRLESRGWKLLRGSATDVRKLAAVLGFNYEQVESGEYVHSNLVTVLNPRGEIVHQQNGAGGDQAALALAVRHALDEPAQ